jgi:hypothetical protein
VKGRTTVSNERKRERKRKKEKEYAMASLGGQLQPRAAKNSQEQPRTAKKRGQYGELNGIEQKQHSGKVTLT